jgi:hypothetical protein
MADKEESDLVMVSNESETDSNPRKRQGTHLIAHGEWRPLALTQVVTITPHNVSGDRH